MSGPYSYKGPVDCTVLPDEAHCNGKSIVITGGKSKPEVGSKSCYEGTTDEIGAQGIGEAYVRGFVKAG